MTLSSESPDWTRIAEAEATWEAPVLVTVVDTSGSTPRKIGARMLVEALSECPSEDHLLPQKWACVAVGR